MWTDEQLARLQNINCDRDHTHEMDRRMSELYRLCRLGLAAEQVGQEVFRAAVDDEGLDGWDTAMGKEDAANVFKFLNHEAWRK